MCLFRRCHGMSRHRSTSTPSQRKRPRRWTIVVKLLRSRVGPASRPWLMLAPCPHCLAPLLRRRAKKFTGRSNVDGARCLGPDLGLRHRSNTGSIRERRSPICALNRKSCSASCDNLLGNHYCGDGTPRRNRRLRRFATLRRLLAIASQDQTSYGFPMHFKTGQLPHNNCDASWSRNPRVRYQLW
jgi:hypothetical protein